MPLNRKRNWQHFAFKPFAAVLNLFFGDAARAALD